MATDDSAKKDTVRIALPPRTAASVSRADELPTKGPRLRLPPRPPVNGAAGRAAVEPPKVAPPPRPPIPRPADLPGLGKRPAAQMPAPIREPASPIEDSPVFAIPTPLPPAPPKPIPFPPITARPPAAIFPPSPPTAKPPPPVLRRDDSPAGGARGALATPPAPLQPPATPSSAAEFPIPAPREAARNETARVVPLPERKPPVAAVKMAKTQRLIPAPPSNTETQRLLRAPFSSISLLDLIPVPVCWSCLAVSAILCAIQVWTYLA